MTNVFIAFFLIIAAVSGIGIGACILASFLLHLPSLIRQHAARSLTGRLARVSQPGEPTTPSVLPLRRVK